MAMMVYIGSGKYGHANREKSARPAVVGMQTSFYGPIIRVTETEIVTKWPGEATERVHKKPLQVPRGVMKSFYAV